jgi:hypothetical protein
MLYGTVSEVSLFSKEFAMVGGNGDEGVLGHDIEKFFHNTINIFNSFDLPVAKIVESLLIEKFFFLDEQLAADDLVIEVLENAVYATDARPILRRFVGQSVRVVRFADV